MEGTDEKPPWLRYTLPPQGHEGTRAILERHGVRTVCASARCPNLPICWAGGCATFMILGDRCTRRCRFCAVPHGRPGDDPIEGERIANAARELGLRHVVITSVTRDDLPDQGASAFVEVTRRLREACPPPTVELLTPDLWGREELVKIIAGCRPDVVGHNLETVRRLSPSVRDVATYDRSLATLSLYRKALPRTPLKSSLMLGLGEREEEVLEAMDDLLVAGADMLTLGQYLRPRGSDLEVAEYVSPERFLRLGEAALERGFAHVSSAPFVRSSYRAGEALKEICDAR